VSTVREQLKNYKTFKALTAEWADLALEIAKEQHKEETQGLKESARSRATRVDVRIAWLRQPQWIPTVHGLGYQLAGK